MISKEKMLELTQKQYEAYNRRDLEKFCECYHPEVKVRFILSNKELCSNIAEFKERYRQMFEASPNLHCELKSRIVLDAVVVDEEWVTGNSRSPQGIHTVAIYAFRDNLISDVWFPA